MFRGWWIVATHFVVMFYATGFYQYGLPLLVPSVIEEFDTDATTINALFTLNLALGLVVSPTAGPFVDRWSARGLLLIGASVLAAGIAALSFASSALVFVLIGGTALGLAMTLCGPMAGSAVITRFFTASRGRALGIAAIGTSVGGFVLPLFFAFALPSIGWRGSLQVLAAAIATIALPLLLFRFWDTPEAAGIEQEPLAAGTVSDPADAVPAMTSREILSRPAFWLFTLSLALFIAVFTSTVANLGQHFADRGFGEAQAGWLMSLLAVGGVAGKLGFGALADRVVLKVAFLAAIGATATALCVLLLEPGFGVLIPMAILLGVATGGILPVWNALLPKLFGVRNFGRTMGLMGPVISLVNMPVFLLVGSVRDATGSYAAVYQGHLVVLAVAVAIALVLREAPVERET